LETKLRNGDIFIVNITKLRKMKDGVLQILRQRKGNMENIPEIKDCNDRFLTDFVGKAKSRNFYFASVFGCPHTFHK